jgi:hypothetical protein
MTTRTRHSWRRVAGAVFLLGALLVGRTGTAAGSNRPRSVLVLYGFCILLGASALVLTYANSGQSALLLLVLEAQGLRFHLVATRVRSIAYPLARQPHHNQIRNLTHHRPETMRLDMRKCLLARDLERPECGSRHLKSSDDCLKVHPSFQS